MNIPLEILKTSKIKSYKGPVYIGDLDFSNGWVRGVTEYCMELFVGAPVPHFMSTFVYFYLDNEQQENPVTCSAFGRTLSVHPGQGRVIAAYLRGDSTIQSLLIPLNFTQEETSFLHEVSLNTKEFEESVFSYKNQNHVGISTRKFEDYFYPTDVRLEYEKRKQEILDEKLNDYYPIEFMFNDRETIRVGKGKKTRTQVFCKNPQGLFEFLAYCADGKFANSENYKLL